MIGLMFNIFEEIMEMTGALIIFLGLVSLPAWLIYLWITGGTL